MNKVTSFFNSPLGLAYVVFLGAEAIVCIGYCLSIKDAEKQINKFSNELIATQDKKLDEIKEEIASIKGDA